ncbi:MAG TPA: S-methyl-5-thioribose-1-phosphate isomerase [bacterium]|nr:S-methyl-5-thioribose-1-phosphate isomerase [bacterium]HQL63038.1 S-methyl-5-thioribose-1-phosphate isomerase [bacterium]
MAEPTGNREIRTIRWENNTAILIDQTLLPGTCREIPIRTVEEMWEAIRTLRVRGAPAIGIATAYGVCLGLQGRTYTDSRAVIERVNEVADYLATCRPTAVNLFWALNRMRRTAHAHASLSPTDLCARLLEEAHAILREDNETCRAIGRFGAELIQDGMTVLTHCNAGGLATACYGTALAPLFSAHEFGKRFQVYADETRPLLQGARLTTWELKQHGIPVTLICDNMAAHCMKIGRIQLIIVGADRIALNGDTANKIGTYGVALAAQAHKIPFYIAAPRSTIDRSIPSGNEIPIEERDPREVVSFGGISIAPEGIRAYNPAFDVTPADLIAGIITEVGILRPPYMESIQWAFSQTPA